MKGKEGEINEQGKEGENNEEGEERENNEKGKEEETNEKGKEGENNEKGKEGENNEKGPPGNANGPKFLPLSIPKREEKREDYMPPVNFAPWEKYKGSGLWRWDLGNGDEI